MVPRYLGEAGRGSAGTRRMASTASGTRAAALEVPPGAAPRMLEPVESGDLRRGPRPRRGGRQPAAREEGATAPPRGAMESGRGREQANPPLMEGPPREGDGGSAEEAARRVGAQRGHTPGQGKRPGGDFTRGGGPPSSRLPTDGRERSQVATGVGAAAGGVGEGRRGELRAQPPDPLGDGSCWRYACGALCRGGQPWCSRGTAWREKCSPLTR